MKTIPAAQGQQILVDDEDFERLSQYRWLVYSRRTGYEYAVTQIDGMRTYMHRILCGTPGRVIDHINGNTLDNRRSNLRAVSNRENIQNQHSAAQSNTGLKNVHRFRKSFTARVNGIYLGSFPTAEQASTAVRAYRASSGDLQQLLKVIAELTAENAELRMRAAA
ncbi:MULTISPECIES: HNH endonuclease signature motif containing protein [Xanthomonas]|uniref:HNH endonuclease n=1 Tax=Xanthomonas dyei TaxID=743699 RepID=A0ABZ0DAQ8_9XANT|nr:HNH endonuclease signature motif containing protein [Xanthomonas dyei]WOB24770.1 HNH endonuclease [Xanthomonas dyei]WOB52398.1 HNH endonuclease [Xanthomonas dyei]